MNYPNPFNPTTTIEYGIPKASYVTLKIYNLLGQEIKTLVNEQINSGKHSVIWNGTDNNGNKVNSGIYIYTIQAGELRETKKLMLMK